jgi:hypothetical protein
VDLDALKLNLKQKNVSVRRFPLKKIYVQFYTMTGFDLTTQKLYKISASIDDTTLCTYVHICTDHPAVGNISLKIKIDY